MKNVLYMNYIYNNCIIYIAKIFIYSKLCKNVKGTNNAVRIIYVFYTFNIRVCIEKTYYE